MPHDFRRLLHPLTTAFLLAWYLFFTARSLNLYFDPDDVMNLYFAWREPLSHLLRANLFFWSDSYRPLGALFYRALFAMAGFHPLPFRIVCLAIGAANIALCWWFVRLIMASEPDRSRRVAALALLLFAFHPRLLEVWYRTAVIYDLLCFTFFYTAVCLYIAARRRGEYPGPLRIAAILLCFIAALDMKEMAVALPVVLVVYELLFERGRLTRLWLPVCLGLLNVPYLLGKTGGASRLADNAFYRPEYTWGRFGHAWALYLNYIFVRETIVPAAALAVLAALLAFALLLRSRPLVMAWLLVLVATLPVSFIPYRGGFVLYIAWAGWVLYAAWLLVALEDAILRFYPQIRLPLACAVFLLVAWRFGKHNLHEQRHDSRRWLYDPPALVHSFVTQMRALHPVFPRGARLLFLDDAFTNEEWTPYFILKLAWLDDTLTVDRVKMMNGKKPDWNSYQYVFTFDHDLYRQLKPEK